MSSPTSSKISELVYKVINYFHQDDRINRITLGLDKHPILAQLSRWKFADLLYIGVLFVLYFVVYWIEPFQRQFYVNDLTISHPFAEHERVPVGALFFYSTWVPISLIAIIGIIITKPKNKIYVTYISLVGLVISVFSTSVLTDILKNFIGRHRPDFLSRCVPKEGTPINVLVYAKDVCTTDNISRLKDGFRTTPSGHSSISFAGLFYLSLWLSGQLVVTNANVGSWRTIIAGLPTLGAGLIALSRTEDYRHHFVDVLIGSTIGIIIAYWSYHRNFPSVSHPKSYEPRIIIEEDERDDSISYTRIDESAV